MQWAPDHSGRDVKEISAVRKRLRQYCSTSMLSPKSRIHICTTYLLSLNVKIPANITHLWRVCKIRSGRKVHLSSIAYSRLPFQNEPVFWSSLARPLCSYRLISVLARSAYKDIVAVGQTIRAADPSELVWTIARVPFLDDREDRSVVAGYIGDGKVGFHLGRPAFAAFVFRELEENQWCLKAPVISSPW